LYKLIHVFLNLPILNRHLLGATLAERGSTFGKPKASVTKRL
jgi:hypothetical protein